jgi:hypothetical protein
MFIKDIHDYTIISESKQYINFMKGDKNILDKFRLLIDIRNKALSQMKNGDIIHQFTFKLYSKRNIYDQLI